MTTKARYTATAALSADLGNEYITRVADAASTDRETAAAALLTVLHGRADQRRRGTEPTGLIVSAAVALVSSLSVATPPKGC